MPARKSILATLSTTAALCFVLLAPSVASAQFVRPLVRQVTGTCEKAEEVPPACLGSKFVPFAGSDGIAVDGKDDLWVAEGSALREFEPSGGYVKSVTLSGLGEQIENFAIDNSSTTDHFYIDSQVGNQNVEVFGEAGNLVGEFDHSNTETPFAIDNSLGSSAGSVYVRNEQIEKKVLEKFGPSGKEEAFSGMASYITGHMIDGYHEPYDCPRGCELDAVTVDPANGDIYVGANNWYVNGSGTTEPGAVLVFSSSGVFLRVIPGSAAPKPPIFPLGKGFGAQIRSLVVDPSDGDLLVAFSGTNAEGVVVGAVDEFSSGGAFLGQMLEADGMPLNDHLRLAADSHGNIYVVSVEQPGQLPNASSRVVDVLGAGHFVPGLRVGAASGVGVSGGVLNGSVDPESELNVEKSGLSDCRFEYVSEAAFQKTGFEDLESGGVVACEHPGAGEVPKTDAFTGVHAAVSEHVLSGVTYRYRLSATVGGLQGGTASSEPSAFTAAHAPRVSGTVANEISSTFAEFGGNVDPLGADTTYWFEYLPVAQFDANGGTFAGASRTPQVDVGAGGEAGDLSETVVRGVGGLTPETSYRYRLVASNMVGVSEGETGGGGEVARVFTTEPAVLPGLPDGRAYELLTPTDKAGSQDMFGELFNGHIFERGVSSESGDQFMLSTPAAFGPFPAAARNMYVFSRHPAPDGSGRMEWGFTSLVSPTLGIQDLGKFYEDRSNVIDPADFSLVAFNDQVGQAESEKGFSLTGLTGPPGGPYTTLYKDQYTHELGAGFVAAHPQETTEVVGGSRDLGVLVLRSDNPLLLEGGHCSGDPEGVSCLPPIFHLYERMDGKLQRLDVQSASNEFVSTCGGALGAGDRMHEGETSGIANGAVSRDGSQVFFTAPIPLQEAQGEGLAGMAGCPTVNGAKLENPAQLYVRLGEETVEVSAPEEGAPDKTARFEAHYVRASDDGSRVFFTSEGELAATGDSPVRDSELYEWRTEGTSGCANSQGCLTRISGGASGSAAGGVVDDNQRTGGLSGSIEVSPDGSHVYFVAKGVLAGANAQGKTPTAGQDNIYVYDTQTGHTAYIGPAFSYSGGAGHSDESGEPTPDGRFLLFRSPSELTPGAGAGQLYRYEAASEGIVCVSCAPGGQSSPAIHPPEIFETPQDLPANAISSDGAYVFFDTTASLLPQDTNGVLDVYEWHEGKISLLSTGQDALNSYFMGAGADGSNVFIGTHSKLVPADTDTTGNLYDARICTTTEPCIKAAPAREGLCEGDACAHPPAAPNDATPSSLTFTGPGDVLKELLAPNVTKVPAKKQAKCVKPKKRRGGKCVKVKKKAKKAKRRAKRAGHDRRAKS